jgi:hypothetical protein
MQKYVYFVGWFFPFIANINTLFWWSGPQNFTPFPPDGCWIPEEWTVDMLIIIFARTFYYVSSCILCLTYNSKFVGKFINSKECLPNYNIYDWAKPNKLMHKISFRAFTLYLSIALFLCQNQNCPSMYKDMYYKANKWTTDLTSAKGRGGLLSEIDSVFHSLH